MAGNLAERFAVAVSLRESYKVGIGGTTREHDRVLYYFAEKTPETGISLQVINGSNVPSGEKTPVDEEDFLKRFKPEPLFYYNKVKPSMETMLTELDRGEKHLEAGRLNKAEKCFKKAMEYDAENLRAIFGLGNAYLAAENMEDAREIFEKIMSIELAFGPDNKHLFNGFGISMRKCGLRDMAKAYYEKALTVTADDEHLLFNLGRIQFEQGDFAAAIVSAEKALALNPDFLLADKLLRAAQKAAATAPQVEPAATPESASSALDPGMPDIPV